MLKFSKINPHASHFFLLITITTNTTDNPNMARTGPPSKKPRNAPVDAVLGDGTEEPDDPEEPEEPEEPEWKRIMSYAYRAGNIGVMIFASDRIKDEAPALLNNIFQSPGLFTPATCAFITCLYSSIRRDEDPNDVFTEFNPLSLRDINDIFGFLGDLNFIGRSTDLRGYPKFMSREAVMNGEDVLIEAESAIYWEVCFGEGNERGLNEFSSRVERDEFAWGIIRIEVYDFETGIKSYRFIAVFTQSGDMRTHYITGGEVGSRVAVTCNLRRLLLTREGRDALLAHLSIPYSRRRQELRFETDAWGNPIHVIYFPKLQKVLPMDFPNAMETDPLRRSTFGKPNFGNRLAPNQFWAYDIIDVNESVMVTEIDNY